MMRVPGFQHPRITLHNPKLAAPAALFPGWCGGSCPVEGLPGCARLAIAQHLCYLGLSWGWAGAAGPRAGPESLNPPRCAAQGSTAQQLLCSSPGTTVPEEICYPRGCPCCPQWVWLLLVGNGHGCGSKVSTGDMMATGLAGILNWWEQWFPHAQTSPGKAKPG